MNHMLRGAGVGLVLLNVWAAVPVYAQEEVTPTPSPTPAAASEVNSALEELAKNQADISAKKEEIEALDKKIQELKGRRDTTAAEATIIAGQVERLQGQLQKAQLELKQTELTIHVVRKEKQDTETAIEQIHEEVAASREELRVLVRELYTKEQQSFLHILFDTGSLADALAQRGAYKRLQERQSELLEELRGRQKALAEEQAALAQQQTDLGELQEVLEAQKVELRAQESEQKQFLQSKKQQQVQYEAKLVEAKQARLEIEQDIFTLKNSGIKLSLTEATDMARYAGKLTGVRPALLLGVLKVETNLGTNLGSGKYPDDMQPSSREAFLRVTKKLGLDPAQAPISARPRSYQGWGGAMGPGQFMPLTWEQIESRVGQLMNKPTPNPYELTDAFVATALFLADRGATNPAQEYEAVNRYLAGPNWQRFTWYGDRVLAVAKEYEKEGL